MKSIRTLIFISFICITISCNKSGKQVEDAQFADKEANEAAAPFLTTDNEGNAVLCWTAKDAGDSSYQLKYAVYDARHGRLATPAVVSPSFGTSISGESMNKVAFKKDGTAVGVFAKKFSNQKNPWAGAIFYSMSKDGKNWSREKFISSDTAHTYGRSFFDIATLKNGEIAAIWLDGRYGETIKGSALFFSQTKRDRGFGRNSCINKNTCECCRTELLSDSRGDIHIAYRSILFPPALLGKQVRDMVYMASADNGKTFSTPKTISEDNWAIEGCPHTGPSLVRSDKGVEAVWFTAAGLEGVYRTYTNNVTGAFYKKSLITSTGRHPQATMLPGNRLAIVYEEALQVQHTNHSGKHSMDHHNAASNSKIVLNILEKGAETRRIELTDGTHAEHHAVLIPVKNDLLVAWTRESAGKPRVCYSKIEL